MNDTPTNRLTPDPIADMAAEPRRRGRPPNIPRPVQTQPMQNALQAEPREPAPTMRAPALEDPRARAARRAFELREHLGNIDSGTDEYAIDKRIIPDGWSYEWKRHSTLGKEDPSYSTQLYTRGWEPVPTSRHPEMMPKGHDLSAAIEKKGMILMERPLEITKEVEAIELRKARSQVGAKEAQLNNAPPGTFGRDNKGAPLVNVKREFGYEPIAIPK
jgi:hypothetical protein